MPKREEIEKMGALMLLASRETEVALVGGGAVPGSLSFNKTAQIQLSQIALTLLELPIDTKPHTPAATMERKTPLGWQ